MKEERMGNILRLAVFITLCGWLAETAAGVELAPELAKLHAVGPFGEGNSEAAAAWAKIVEADADQLPVLLASLDGANPLAANWIRTAIDAVAQRQLIDACIANERRASNGSPDFQGVGPKRLTIDNATINKRGGPLPANALEAFVVQTRHSPRARRLAYELLLKADPEAQRRLIEGFLDDPSLEFRRDAVEHLADAAKKLADDGKPGEAIRPYSRAFDAARDVDQIEHLAETLRKLGEEVDLARHYGFVPRWQVIGPFDNTDEKGYDTVYPPEEGIHLDTECEGKHGTVRWIDHQSDHEMGQIDLNKLLGQEKAVVGYAAAVFDSPTQREVQFRSSSYNAIKIWLNGELIDEHNVYHSGSQLDQYTATATLKPGRNLIMVKVCQNAQTQDWTNVWAFQLRVCDEIGGAIDD